MRKGLLFLKFLWKAGWCEKRKNRNLFQSLYRSWTVGNACVPSLWNPESDFRIGDSTGTVFKKMGNLGTGFLCGNSGNPGDSAHPSGGRGMSGRRSDFWSGLGIYLQLCRNLCRLSGSFFPVHKIWASFCKKQNRREKLQEIHRMAGKRQRI